MGKDFADMICAVIAGYIVMGVVLGISIALTVIYVIPFLWGCIKPTIHYWTT